MEKTHNTQPSVILSKVKNGSEKIIFSINFKSVFQLVFSFLLSSASFFSDMSPLGLAFYAAIFSKDYWIINYISSCVAVLIFDIPHPLIYIAAFTLLTASMAVIDFGLNKYKAPLFSSVVLFAMKLVHLASGGFILYNFFALVIECTLLFAACLIFQKSIPVILSVGKRKFISTPESLCTMSFLAFSALALASYPDIYGFKISTVVSILAIYIFSLGGINGGSVILGVLLGTVGSLKSGSFSHITSGFAFGSLLASAFALYGKMGVVLGFTIANTVSTLFLSDTHSITVGIYESLAAAIIFALIPQKICMYFSGMFQKRCGGENYFRFSPEPTVELVKNRLGEMSRSFRELSEVYSSSAPVRELGKDYINTKFKDLISVACNNCPSKNKCFRDNSSIGYRHLSAMLESGFKNGKITPAVLPAEFRKSCRRQSFFVDKFNAMLNIIKTEKQWLSKLNDSRNLMSDQLLAISDSLEAEQKGCDFYVDFAFEETIRAELDKAEITPKKIVAKKYPDGSFSVCVSTKISKTDKKQINTIKNIISHISGRSITVSSPSKHGGDISHSFFPAKKYTVSFGCALCSKKGEEKSGDSVKIISSDGYHHFAVLSDGMGSGPEASKESCVTVMLMEKFLKAGFDSDTAVKLINSSLLLKSSRDSFSTIDLCAINTADSSLMFTKLGAASSYIHSRDGIKLVKGCTLPAGILRSVDVEKHLLAIDSDTTVVLMSDGVADISLKNPSCDGWIEKELMKLKTSNPQLIASSLMETAMRLQSGEAADDMTVIVISVKKV